MSLDPVWNFFKNRLKNRMPLLEKEIYKFGSFLLIGSKVSFGAANPCLTDRWNAKSAEESAVRDSFCGIPWKF
jgi:hypothetical protein